MNGIKEIADKDQRIIGHLAFHPKFEISVRTPGYLKDWALIELDEGKFPNGIENKVYITPAEGKPKPLRAHDFLSLHLPDKTNGQRMADKADAATYMVGKRGATTGLTFGTQSAIEAVVRIPNQGNGHFYAWEMLIVPSNRASVFTKKGDSGSSIFDYEGRIVGLVTGSNIVKPDNNKEQYRGIPVVKGVRDDERVLKQWSGEKPSPEAAKAATEKLETWDIGTDITFATPIEWVLDDIQDFTGHKARLA
jgi:hypothetical protein